MPLPGIGFAGGSAWYLKLSNLAGVCLKQALIYKKHIVYGMLQRTLYILKKIEVFLYGDSVFAAVRWC